jgi:crossover junction endodeoxyribonuclease RusA
VLPYVRPPLTLNGRLHHMARYRITRQVKADVHRLAVAARLPKSCRRAAVTLVYEPPDRRRRDTDNLFATIKPAVDGLVAYGLVPDDDSRHVATVCRVGEVVRGGRLWLLIEVER